MPAWLPSRETLWAKYGRAWGWPPATMRYEEDRLDLARHEVEIAANETFNYAVLDRGESELLGCVYIDPPDAEPATGAGAGTDAIVSWWVVDAQVGGPLDHALRDFVPEWLTSVWGFRAVRYAP